MSIQTIEIKVSPSKRNDEAFIREQVAQKMGFKSDSKFFFQIRKESLDARRKPISYQLRIDVADRLDDFEPVTNFTPKKLQDKKALIIGFGPAGMFAAIKLLSEGIKPIVVERGKAVRPRRRDLAAIFKLREINPESNYCFGEGGAGTFSDGKLYTRSKKRGDIASVLQTFIEHGAKESIRYEAHPHIGTNKLPGIVENIRETILKNGGEVHFETKVTDFLISDNQVVGVDTDKGAFEVNHVILATGHSARDIFEMLHKAGCKIEAKSFALGVRIEHPQDLIDKIQYKCDRRGDHLPPAAYSIVRQVNNRGVFSFCMCPGGIVAPSMTAPEEIVVNGWSPSKRNGEFANSGLVVQVLPEDWQRFGANNPLGALELQKEIEHKAFVAGGSDYSAPAQKVDDFLKGKLSKRLRPSSYTLGLKSANMKDLLPNFVGDRLLGGLQHFGKVMKGYSGETAQLIGVESRTSSPIRIPRDRETLEHPEIKGLFPCGEGAGYAGGIMSAALDGIACAEAIANQVYKES